MRGSRLGWWAWPVVCAAVALGLYANALDNPFVSDDVLMIAGNPTVTQPSTAALVRLWTVDYWQGVDPQGHVQEVGGDRGLYRPVTIASYWLEARCCGVTPRAFRLVNVLLHAAAAWVVGLWCAAWLGVAAGVAASAVVLFHPTATDVVNRIVGRADILALLAVAGFLLVQRTAQRAPWTWPRVLAAAACAVVALGAKESGAAVLPLAAVQAWLGRQPAAARAARHSRRAALALGLVLVLYLGGRAAAVSRIGYDHGPWDLIGNPLAGTTLSARLPAVGTLVLGYLRLLVAPWPLFAFDLPTRLPDWSDPRAGLGLAALALLAAAAAGLLVRRHVLGLALASWLAGFLIVGQLVLPLGTYRDVRLAYGMLGSLALAMGWLVAPVSRWRRSRRQVALALVTTMMVTWAALVVRRNFDFRSDIALLEADARRRPDDASTLGRLGGLYERAGRLTEAERAFTRAVELAPESPEAAYELALWYQNRGKRDAAKRFYERTLELYPEHPMALVALGSMALDSDDLNAAARLLTRAAELAPDDPFVVYDLAVLDERRGNVAGAIERLERLVARHPEYGQAVQGLAALRGQRR
jgi:tetratricopeptide (TPR) repeat protein